MLKDKSILVIGARSGGYGESIAVAAKNAGARVLCTSLLPDDPAERAYFEQLGVELLPVALKFDVNRSRDVFDALAAMASELKRLSATPLYSVVHAVAGGFPRHPSVMKAIGDIFKGKLTFNDLATAVKRNVMYVNAGSFMDAIDGLADACNDETSYVALTYRGRLPYFISPTKAHLEKLALLGARKGKRTLIAALPEAWTQSSQFFTGIEIAVLGAYFDELQGKTPHPLVAEPYARMTQALETNPEFAQLAPEILPFYTERWSAINTSIPLDALALIVQEFFSALKNKGKFGALRGSVETVSSFVREASGAIVAKEFIDEQRFNPGDVRQVFYRDLLGGTEIGEAEPRPPQTRGKARTWKTCDKDEITRTLSMYGKNFLFVDNVIMEDCDLYDGFMGFATYTAPTPEQNPILKDHFVNMPLFPGHLQMEAVAQFGVFLILKLLKDNKLLPTLTGTEFPELNTMAPPGETLTMMATIRLVDRRKLTFEALIENRYTRSSGKVQGMLLSPRVLKKMLSSFETDRESSDAPSED